MPPGQEADCKAALGKFPGYRSLSLSWRWLEHSTHLSTTITLYNNTPCKWSFSKFDIFTETPLGKSRTYRGSWLIPCGRCKSRKWSCLLRYLISSNQLYSVEKLSYSHGGLFSTGSTPFKQSWESCAACKPPHSVERSEYLNNSQ